MDTVNGKIDLLSLDANEVSELAASLGFPKYRAKQISEWLARGVRPERMSNLPQKDRQTLEDKCAWYMPEIENRLVSAVDGTKKYLLRLFDGECVEAVLMKYEHGNTVCVSSQVGCRMGCKFCASTIGGRVRDLYASEILGEVMAVAADIAPERVDGIVMMGIGEPLDNYANTVKFLRLVTSADGMNIGARHISVSTCGLCPNIRALADEGLPLTLSVSLHAASDEVRDGIMPVNRKYPIAELMDACAYFYTKTGRRLSFEYTLIAGKNDTLPEAERLARLIKKNIPGTAHVNLIPLNPVKETMLSTSTRDNVRLFCERLNSLGVTATVRRRLGPDINASCGQLRRQSAASRQSASRHGASDGNNGQ